jgi:hypothetical protein
MPFNVMESARVVTYLIAKILMGLGAKKNMPLDSRKQLRASAQGKKLRT